MSYLTEENIRDFIEAYRSWGPLPGILLTFLKSFIPPLPTIVIVGINAAVYGMWLGFLYSWIGMVAGCLTTFMLVKTVASSRYVRKWTDKAKVRRSMEWVRRNGFGYVFWLSIFPVGPFVVVNMAAAAARMRTSSFITAIAFGKAIMVLAISYIGHDVSQFIKHPYRLIYVLLFVAVSVWASRRIEAYFAAKAGRGKGTLNPEEQAS
ncbi:hypothetical protein DCC85_07095 [Paenibacillus sp. CAA11]|uniref:TVP38/TMEM64 family protein n=1 Tax=Paenibacillus sp. CAA11 TaxID=1532905 RepID=UPI000D34AE54|nr:TVP38/TMEM64 family protein [Paenibacillus sp. CAA11]AWB46852.1 hypothetical protein DCC85_07095 [Paenibacillus sp. CAA11]